jgi:hypothetical protein
MTGCIALAKTLAISALAACGLLMAGGQFNTGDRVADDSSGIQITADAGVRADELATTVAADVSADIQGELDAADCLDNCLAPCAAACADPQGPALDGAVRIDAALGAAVAQEPTCGCSDEASSVALQAEGDAGLESDSSTTDLGASAGTIATFGSAGN